MSFFSGTDPSFEEVSTLTKQQQPILSQLLAALQGQGAGGAFGTAADYYRNLLSNQSEDVNTFAAPELRRFREETMPDLAEQFAGMGSGGLSSSGFRNAAAQAGTSLSERLAAIRAGLRQNAAQGLAGLGQQGLGTFKENVYMPGQEGAAGTIGSLLGGAAGMYFGGPAGMAIGSNLGRSATNALA